jgi:anti-sigma B factor antagonist
VHEGKPSPVREIRDAGGVVSVVVGGSLCGPEATKLLLDAVQEVRSGGASRIVLDLAGIETIDSVGLGTVASAYVTVTQAGGKLVLAAAPPKVHDLLSTTMLLQVIPLYPDEESARRALSP